MGVHATVIQHSSNQAEALLWGLNWQQRSPGLPAGSGHRPPGPGHPPPPRKNRPGRSGRLHKSRAFLRFSPQQGAAADAAGPGHAVHSRGQGIRHQGTTGDVVQKEQGIRPAGDHVVHAHGHQIDSHLPVAAQSCARPAWCPPHRPRPPAGAVAGRRAHGRESAKAPQAAHHFRTARAGRHGADPLNKGIARLNVHTSAAIVHGRACTKSWF